MTRAYAAAWRVWLLFVLSSLCIFFLNLAVVVAVFITQLLIVSALEMRRTHKFNANRASRLTDTLAMSSAPTTHNYIWANLQAIVKIKCKIYANKFSPPPPPAHTHHFPGGKMKRFSPFCNDNNEDFLYFQDKSHFFRLTPDMWPLYRFLQFFFKTPINERICSLASVEIIHAIFLSQPLVWFANRLFLIH